MDTNLSVHYFGIGIAAFGTTLLPILVALILGLGRKLAIRPFFVGALAFFVSQGLLRLPLLSFLAYNTQWYAPFVSTLWGSLLVGGLSAGLFEESARLAAGKVLLKNRTAYRDALSFGLGHAFCEILLVIGLSNVSLLLNAALLENGTLDAMAAAGTIASESLEQLNGAIRQFTPSLALLSLLERFSAAIFHIFATVLVFRAINEKKPMFYFAAILAHTLMNFLSALAVQKLGALGGEIVILLLAAAAAVYTIRARTAFHAQQEIPQ